MKPASLIIVAAVLLTTCVDHNLPCRPMHGLWGPEKMLVEMSFAETVCDPATGISIRFSDVIDSTCPEGFFCIWAGEVRISLDIMRNEQVTGSFDLRVGEQKELGVKQQLFVFTLDGVTPNPQTDKTEKHHYRINLGIEPK
jgi:hypothetical protein